MVLLPCFVSAKNPEEFIFRWEYNCSKDGSYSNCYNRDFIFENSDSFLIASGEKKFELFDKKTGEIVDYSAIYNAMEKIDDNYVAFSVEEDAETNVYTIKFVLFDTKMNILKEKELKNELRYFTSFEIEDNKVSLYDNGGNKYYIDKDLNITFSKPKNDGSYTIFLGEAYGDVSYVVKYDKEHNEVNRVTLENCRYIWNTEYVEYEDYFIIKYFNYYYTSGSYKSVKVNTFYLIDGEANLIDTVVKESTTVTYDDIYIGIDGKAYTSHYTNYNTKDENSLVDLIEIKDNKLVLTLIDNPADPVPKPYKGDKIEDEFRSIIDKEFSDLSYYDLSYEILDDNYVIYLFWSDGGKAIYEFRLYDSSKKLLFKKDYTELNNVSSILDTFIWNKNNIGLMVLKEGKFLLHFYDKDMNFMYEVDTNYTDEYFTGGEVTGTTSGMIVKLFEITSFPCGVDEKINDTLAKGFPEQSLYCSSYTNVGFQYYEYPFNVITKTDGHGSLVVSKENRIDEGEEVVFSITPGEGYVLGEVIITDMFGNKIPYTDNKFIMPNSDVIVEVNFIKIEENPDTSDYVTIVLLIILFINVFYRYKISRKSEFLN